MGADIELPHNLSQQSIGAEGEEGEEGEENDDDFAELRPMGTSTPINSTENLANVLQNIRTFQQAPPSKEGARGRKRGKTTILTSKDSFEEVRVEKEARGAKQLATEKSSHSCEKVDCCCKVSSGRKTYNSTKTCNGTKSYKQTTEDYADNSNSEEN